jgi:2-iminobutanoate/2-iminopropanoate deaminase
MPREIVSSDQAPRAIGPYSQAVAVDLPSSSAGRMVFCSGQIPLDPVSGEMVGAGDVRVQTDRVLQNLDAVLRAGGASLAMVVKTTIYLADLQDFGAVNEVYARYFAERPPARVTIQAAGLPRGAMVEIDAIAVVGG